MRVVRKIPSFGRRPKQDKAGPSDFAPIHKTERYHPKIRSNLEIHTEDQGFISHNNNAYTMQVAAIQRKV